MQLGHLICKFIVTYGWNTWYNDRWPTTDKIIPFRLFNLFAASLESVLGAEQLQLAQSTAQGISMAFSGKDQRVKSSLRSLQRIGYPETRLD